MQLSRIPATLVLIALNTIVFLITWRNAGSFAEPLWTINLFHSGGLYNALTLDDQWFRLFTHMFLHGHLAHLLINMVVLFMAGATIELKFGSLKFLTVFVLSGLAGALCSMYVNLFQLGVGASGAIFGLLGFSLVVDVRASMNEGRSPVPIITTFVLMLVVNLMFAEALHADTTDHFGGLACGTLMALIPVATKRALTDFTPEVVIVPILVAVFIILPRYQVTYYQFFQQVLHTEDSIRRVFSSNTGSDEEFLAAFRKANTGWDSAIHMLDAHIYLPPDLHADTMRLRNYIRLKKRHAQYRINMIERESYIWLDSMEIAESLLGDYNQLDYVLNWTYTPPDTTEQREQKPPGKLTKIFYDSNWIELPYPPGVFYRIGYRDSLQRWQGPLRDYYGNGDVQMKGAYKDSDRHGVFIYYSDHHTYESAGRYDNDQRVGKWETFHPNGRMESEVYYHDRYFLKNYWDSTGVQMVTDGNGTEEHRYPNGVISSRGQYVDGYQHGYWYGLHANGKTYFEEEYFQGRLVRGRARSLTGETVVYDERSFYAQPVGGAAALNNYLRKAAAAADTDVHGTVRISFRVTITQELADVRIEQSLTPQLDELAKEILRKGPRWLPARLHGFEPIDGYAQVSVEF